MIYVLPFPKLLSPEREDVTRFAHFIINTLSSPLYFSRLAVALELSSESFSTACSYTSCSSVITVIAAVSVPSSDSTLLEIPVAASVADTHTKFVFPGALFVIFATSDVVVDFTYDVPQPVVTIAGFAILVSAF